MQWQPHAFVEPQSRQNRSEVWLRISRYPSYVQFLRSSAYSRRSSLLTKVLVQTRIVASLPNRGITINALRHSCHSGTLAIIPRNPATLRSARRPHWHILQPTCFVCPRHSCTESGQTTFDPMTQPTHSPHLKSTTVFCLCSPRALLALALFVCTLRGNDPIFNFDKPFFENVSSGPPKSLER